MGSASSNAMNKEQRFNAMNEERKSQRESLIMKRRGLNFISDQVAESMNDESI